MSENIDHEFFLNADIPKKIVLKLENQGSRFSKLNGSASLFYLSGDTNNPPTTTKMPYGEILRENEEIRKNNPSLMVDHEISTAQDLHLENWLKSRSNSVSSIDFDGDIRCPELDISEFLTEKSSHSHLESSFDGDLISKFSEQGKYFKVHPENEDGINIFNVKPDIKQEEHSNAGPCSSSFMSTVKGDELKKNGSNLKEGLLDDYFIPNIHDWIIDYSSLCSNIIGFKTSSSIDNGATKQHIELGCPNSRASEFVNTEMLDDVTVDHYERKEKISEEEIFTTYLNKHCIEDGVKTNPVNSEKHFITNTMKKAEESGSNAFEVPAMNINKNSLNSKLMNPSATIKLKVFNRKGVRLKKAGLKSISKEKIVKNKSVIVSVLSSKEQSPYPTNNCSINSNEDIPMISKALVEKIQLTKSESQNINSQTTNPEQNLLGLIKRESREVSRADPYLQKQSVMPTSDTSSASETQNETIPLIRLLSPSVEDTKETAMTDVSALSPSKNDKSSIKIEKVPQNQSSPVHVTIRNSKKEHNLSDFSPDRESVPTLMPSGTSPTMVSVPSVLDSLSDTNPSKLEIANVLGVAHDLKSADSGELKNHIEDREYKLNTALEKLGINLDSLCIQTGAQKGKRWRCPLEECAKIFTKLSYLELHILNHRGIRPYKCSYENCEWSFFTTSKLKRHLETHLKRKDFACPNESCDKRFTTIYNLNTHALLHKQPKKWVCSYQDCDESFLTRNEAEKHMKQHPDIYLPYKCTLAGCSKGYFTPGSLASHMRSHQKDKDLSCKWTGCGKKFSKPSGLKTHMRVHTGQRPYVCNFEGCNWRFQCASKLSRHQKKHTNDRKFTCHICKKAFLRSEHLKGHVLTHSGVRNFSCNVCGSKFTAKSSLYVHLKKHRIARQAGQLIPDNTEKSSEVETSSARIVDSEFKQLDYIPLMTDQEMNIDVTNNSPLHKDCTPAAVFDCFSKITSSEHSATDSLMLPFLSVNASNTSEAQETTLSVSEHLFPQTISVIDGTPHLGVDLAFLDVSMRAQKESLKTSGAKFKKPSSYISETSARTDVLGNMILSHRAKRRQRLNLEQKITNAAVSVNKSSLMIPGREPPQTFTFHTANIQDAQMNTGFYPDGLIGAELLSDSVEFAESTINLRDLE